MYYQNVRGLRTKSNSFFCNSSITDFNIIVLTETWLNYSINSSEYFDNSFNVFRKDRCETGSLLKRGGGVLIAVKSNFVSNNIVIADAENIEYVCVRLTLHSKSNVFIYAAYIPPNSNAIVYENHLSAINKIPLTQNDTIIIFGDFNLPNSNWILDDSVLLPTEIKPQFAADFIQNIIENGLYQINSIKNPNGKLLDLIFSNDHLNFEIDSPPPLSTVDTQYHPPILLTYEWIKQNKNEHQNSVRDFSKADFIGMNNYFSHIHFLNKFNDKSLDEKVTIFHEIISDAVDKFVPLKRIKSKTSCPWNNKTLRHLKNKKNKQWKKFKLTGNKHDFNLAYDEFNTMNKKLYDDYLNKMTSNLKSDPSSFWRFVNAKKSNDGDPKLLTLNEISTTDKATQADLFATFFSKIFSNNPQSIPNHPQPHSNVNNDELLLDEHFIFDELLKINTKKGVGPDYIHPLLLKNCSALLLQPLVIIFNESLKNGVFPELWKRSSLKPIFKKGSRSNIENYRGIAKLPTIAKFFEYLVNLKLTKSIENKITPQQHGFMRKRSTSSNLTEFSQYVHKSINGATQVDVLYTDFSKAFDTLNHEKLLRKLNDFNIPSNLINWIKSYLSNRKQFVSYGNCNSSEFVINSGVPQGSHIGPTLFLLFINDIVNDIGEDVFISLFADDLKIAKEIKNNDDTRKLQLAIDKLNHWCDSNDLHLNLSKCSIMTISRKREPILCNYSYKNQAFNRVYEQKDLGVIVDNKFTFVKHIDMICSKASSALGFIKRFCYDITDIFILKSLYYALVQSTLDYCSIVWMPFYEVHKNKLESCLKQFSMFALKEYPNSSNNYKISSYTDRLDKLNMMSLQRRRINTGLIFLKNLLDNNVHCPSIKNLISTTSNERGLRNIQLFKLNDKNLSNSHTAPLNQIIKWANKTPSIYQSISSSHTFKNELLKIPNDTFLNDAFISNYNAHFNVN